MSSAVVVIPLFREQPAWYEEVSVKQAIKVLNKHDHVVVIPKGLSITLVQKWYAEAGKTVSVVEFDPGYFSSPQSYNKLLLNPLFYEAFQTYDYMLIHQTDAFVFRDELATWMEMGIDYVGAPWIDWVHASYQAKRLSWLGRLQWRFGRRRFDAVGNGGFSLRRISKMVELTTSCKEQAAIYHLNEDFFFAFEVKRLGYTIKIPSIADALRFSFDENPELAFALARNQIPMACHAWPRHIKFWKNYAGLYFPLGNN